jgi:hypothetical protein
VNYKVPASDLWSSALYDHNWIEASGYQFGYLRHTFEVNGYDEYLYVTTATPSTQLEFEPVNGQELNIFDINAIDASGNAGIVPTSDYSLDGKWITFTTPSSLYVAEYTKQTFLWPKFVTFQDRFHTNYNWTNRPTIATDVDDEVVTIPFEIAMSEPPSGILLRVSPEDLRPGNAATVRFDYPNFQRYDWNSPWDDLDVTISDSSHLSRQRNAFTLTDSTGAIVTKGPYQNLEPSGLTGIGISGSSVIRDTSFEGVAPPSIGPSGWSWSSGSRIVSNIHPTDTSQVAFIDTDGFISQAAARPVIEDRYLVTMSIGTASGIADTNLDLQVDGWNENNTWIGSVTENFIPSGTASAGSQGFQEHKRVVTFPHTTDTIEVKLTANTSAMYVSDFKFEPLSVFNASDYSRKYTEPYQLDVYFNAKSTWNVSGVQSLATPTGTVDPYPFDYTIEKRRDTYTNETVEHYVPYTMLAISDPSGYVDNALISGRPGQFTITTPREMVGITYAPEDRLITDKDKRVVYAIERHQQTLNRFNTLGALVDRTPLFCPDLNHIRNNATASPSGGNYLYPASDPLDEMPLVSYELHADNIGADNYDTQLYREPRGMEYRNGHLYIVTAVTDESDTFAARPSGTATFGELEDAIIYRHDSWDHNRIHITPSGDARMLTNGLLTNPTDMSWGPSGVLLIGQSGVVHMFEPHWDYAIIDRDQQIAYYREQYD